MGYMVHHAIIVTTFCSDLVMQALAEAKPLFPDLLGPVQSPVNDHWSLFIPPDGSNEGWYESKQGDHNRDIFIGWLQRHTDKDDGSNVFDYVEVQYGDDDKNTLVLRSSDEDYKQFHRSRRNRADTGL